MNSHAGSLRCIRTLKLYHDQAVRSSRVKWLLYELVGDDFHCETVSLYDAEQFSPRYLAITPSHCVPALEIATDDGHSITMIESGAMVVLLADMFPERNLAPAAHPYSRERAD